jgi:hypothetical protein
MSLDGSLIVDKKKKPILNKSMRNYGFDYLVEKVEIINEMARTAGPNYWERNYPEFYQIMKKTQKAITPFAEGRDVNHLRDEYLGRMLMQFLKIKGIYSELVKDYSFVELTPDERLALGGKKSLKPTEGYLNFELSGNGDNSAPKKQKYFLDVLLRKNYEEATSDKFEKLVTNPENIQKYTGGDPKKKTEGRLDKTASSNYARGMAEKKFELTKMSPKELNDLNSKVIPLIKKLRKSKKVPKGLFTSFHLAPSMNNSNLTSKRDETVNETMIPLLSLQLTLEILLDEKKEIARLIKYKEWDEVDEEQEKLYEFDTTVIQTALNTVNKRIEEQKPTSLDTLKAKIFPLFSDIKKTFMEEFNIAYMQLSENSLAGNVMSTIRKQEYSNIFDTLDDDLLDSLEKEGIINSEDRETLKKWANVSGTLKQNIKTKGEKIVLRNIEKGTKQDEYDKKKKEFEDSKTRKKAQKEEYKDKLEELKDMKIQEIEDTIYDAYNEENPDFNLIEYMEKYLERRKGRQNKKISMYENHVMDYFTEQIQKDELLNQRGECKERGFKKPKNYAHWLWLNEQ